MTLDFNYGVKTSNTLHSFLIFLLLCSYYLNNSRKMFELQLLVVLILSKIKLWNTITGIPKIIISILKTASINLQQVYHYLVDNDTCMVAHSILVELDSQMSRLATANLQMHKTVLSCLTIYARIWRVYITSC